MNNITKMLAGCYDQISPLGGLGITYEELIKKSLADGTIQRAIQDGTFEQKVLQVVSHYEKAANISAVTADKVIQEMVRVLDILPLEVMSDKALNEVFTRVNALIQKEQERLKKKGVLDSIIGAIASLVNPIVGAGLVAASGASTASELSDLKKIAESTQNTANKTAYNREQLINQLQQQQQAQSQAGFGEFFQNKTNLIIASLGAASFIGLLLMGAKEKQKTFSNNSK